MDQPTPIVAPSALQGLIDHDPGAIEALRVMREELERRSGLDERTIELARLGVMVAIAAPDESVHAHVRRALAIGVSPAEIWGVVMAVAPLVGVPRIVATAPAITAALR
jgi:alkylhydroperoxidase/carboxymuconolactone decarboxylase family protein YurZ